MPASEPKIIAGRFEVISQIGAGGVGVVYRAYDPWLKKAVAVKMLHPEQMTSESVVRFQHEAKTASTLVHPNLIRVCDFGITENNEPYLVMDFVEGNTLSNYLEKNGRIPITKAAGIFVQICSGMTMAHEQNVLHRDLKSSNVMLTEENSSHPQVHILDFGLAKRTEDGSMTRTGLLIGSPLYMSPEHARGAELDARADIYSLGCIMYETLTGKYPIKGETILDTIMKQTTQEAPSLQSSCPEESFSPELEHLVAKALHKDPAERFQSMSEVKSAIQSLRELEEQPEPTKARSKPQEPQFATLATSAAPAPKLSFNRKFILTCAIGLATMFGAGALIVLTVPKAIDWFNPNKPSPLVEEPKAPTVSFDLHDDFIPGTTAWTAMPWSDGYVWMKKFDVEEMELLDTKKFNELGYVSFWQEKITRKGLRYLIKANMKGLYLSESDLTDDALVQIGKMTTLKALFLDKNYQLTDSSLAHLEKLKLKGFGVSGNAFSDEALKYIGKMETLEVLYLDHLKNVNGSGLHYLNKLQNLKKLELDGTLIQPQYVPELAKLKNLRVLYLHNVRLNDKNAAIIATLPKLQVLDVSMSSIAFSQLRALKKNKTLKYLYLSGHRATSEELESLKKGATFTVFDISRPDVDDFIHQL